MNIEKLVFKSLRYADSPPRLKLYFWKLQELPKERSWGKQYWNEINVLSTLLTKWHKFIWVVFHVQEQSFYISIS